MIDRSNSIRIKLIAEIIFGAIIAIGLDKFVTEFLFHEHEHFFLHPNLSNLSSPYILDAINFIIVIIWSIAQWRAYYDHYKQREEECISDDNSYIRFLFLIEILLFIDTFVLISLSFRIEKFALWFVLFTDIWFIAYLVWLIIYSKKFSSGRTNKRPRLGVGLQILTILFDKIKFQLFISIILCITVFVFLFFPVLFENISSSIIKFTMGIMVFQSILWLWGDPILRKLSYR